MKRPPDQNPPVYAWVVPVAVAVIALSVFCLFFGAMAGMW